MENIFVSALEILYVQRVLVALHTVGCEFISELHFVFITLKIRKQKKSIFV